MGLLEPINIFGWEDLEDQLLASFVANSNLILIGEKGIGKTYSFKQIARALKLAQKIRTGADFISARLDGYSSQDEDFIGYSMPPTPAQMDEARLKDQSAFMNMVYSPNTIAFSHFVLIDEATRIDQIMQSKYLGLLDQYRIIQGHTIPVETVWGSGNPLTYGATVEMDEALADRFSLVLHPVSFSRMKKQDALNVIASRIKRYDTVALDEKACLKLYDTIQQAKLIYEDVKKEYEKVVSTYIYSLNGDLKKYRLQGRRAAILAENILSAYSVVLAKGESVSLAEIAERSLRPSFVGELHGGENPDENVLKTAHDAHYKILLSERDNLIRELNRIEDPLMAFEKACEKGTNLKDGQMIISNQLASTFAAFREGEKGSKEYGFDEINFCKLFIRELTKLSERKDSDEAYEKVKRFISVRVMDKIMSLKITSDISLASPVLIDIEAIPFENKGKTPNTLNVLTVLMNASGMGAKTVSQMGGLEARSLIEDIKEFSDTVAERYRSGNLGRLSLGTGIASSITQSTKFTNAATTFGQHMEGIGAIKNSDPTYIRAAESIAKSLSHLAK